MKEAKPKRQHAYDSNCITSGKNKTIETVKRSAVARGWDGGGRMNGQSTEGFKAAETLY